MTTYKNIKGLSQENIVDTGTEGTKLAVGTTAQRGSTLGQFRFNSTTELGEYYDGNAFKIIDSPPEVTSVTPTYLTTAALPANVTIAGSNFSAGATVTFVGSGAVEYNASSVTRTNSAQLIAEVPVTVTGTDEPYSIKVANASGLSGVLDNAFNINQKPEFTVAAGSLGNIEHRTSSAGSQLTDIPATDDEGDTVTITTASTLPTGLTLSTAGVWGGTVTQPGSSTLYNITASAADGQGNTSTRAYSFNNNAPSSAKSFITGINGASEYLKQTAPYTSFSSNMSVCFWIKPTVTTGGGTIIQQGAEFWGNEFGWEIHLGNKAIESFITYSNNQLTWMSSANGGNYNGSTIVQGPTLSNGTWVWACVTKSGSSIIWYLNGSSSASGSVSQSSISYPGSSGTSLTISSTSSDNTLNAADIAGDGPGGSSALGGNHGCLNNAYLDEVALWNSTLSSAEVSALYGAMNGGYVDFKSSVGSYSSQGNLKHWFAGGENVTNSTTFADEQAGSWTMNNVTEAANVKTDTPS